MIGGMKFYEQSTYLPTQAIVIANLIKCDMSYRTGRSTSHTVVECADVDLVKARNPEIDWTVAHIPYVAVSYRTAAGQQTMSVERLSKLERTSATVGEEIPILQSR